jgi:hypothetical protein
VVKLNNAELAYMKNSKCDNVLISRVNGSSLWVKECLSSFFHVLGDGNTGSIACSDGGLSTLSSMFNNMHNKSVLTKFKKNDEMC